MKVNIGKYPRSALSANKEREIFVEIEPDDTWNLDNTLAHIIHPALLQIKAAKQGTPYVELEDAPHIARIEGEYGSKYDYSEAAWQYVLDEMIWAMQQIKDNRPEEDLLYARTHINWEKVEQYDKRLQNGCRLFGVYFQGLWS